MICKGPALLSIDFGLTGCSLRPASFFVRKRGKGEWWDNHIALLLRSVYMSNFIQWLSLPTLNFFTIPFLTLHSSVFFYKLKPSLGLKEKSFHFPLTCTDLACHEGIFSHIWRKAESPKMKRKPIILKGHSPSGNSIIYCSLLLSDFTFVLLPLLLFHLSSFSLFFFLLFFYYFIFIKRIHTKVLASA